MFGFWCGDSVGVDSVLVESCDVLVGGSGGFCWSLLMCVSMIMGSIFYFLVRFDCYLIFIFIYDVI